VVGGLERVASSPGLAKLPVVAGSQLLVGRPLVVEDFLLRFF